MAQTTSKTRNFSSASNTVTGIAATGNTVVLELPVQGLKKAFIRFSVTTQALDAFIVEGRAHDGGTYQSLLTAITSTPSGLVVAASGTLASTAAAASAWCMLVVEGLESLRISVSAAADGAAVAIEASAA